MSTSFTLVESAKAESTDVTGAVVAGRDRGMFNLRRADKTDLSIVGVISGRGDLFRPNCRGIRLG